MYQRQETATIEQAQIEANRCGQSIAVLNLNKYGPALFVRRYWNDAYADTWELVARIYPKA